jgi:hypothetical protein
MCSTDDAVPNMEQACPGHTPNFDSREATPFAELVNVLHPGATGKPLVGLLDGKARRTTALDWISGRRNAPQWAIDLLRRKLHERQALELEIAAKAKPGVGKQAGARNLAAYLAKRDR